MRRLASLLAFLALVLVAAAAAHAMPVAETGPATLELWDPDEVSTVVMDDLLGPSVSDFCPADALSWGDLADALAAWGHPIAAPADPTKPVTIRELDARLVAALGLLPAAR